MIVSPESPLYRLPQDADPKRRRFLEAGRFSAQFIDVAYCRLIDGIGHHVPADSFEFGELPTLLLDAWTILDASYRLRGLISNMPALKKKHPEIQVFLGSTEHLEDARNSIQHLNTDIGELTANALPVLGALTWLRPSQSEPGKFLVECIVSGEFQGSLPSAQVEIGENPPTAIEKVTLWAKRVSIDLSAIHEVTRRLVRHLEASVVGPINLTHQSTPDVYIAVTLELS